MTAATQAAPISEEWRPVVGFDGRYEVSSLGRVRSFWKRSPRILTPVVINHGYLRVSLSAQGDGPKKLLRLIHVIVMEAFVGPRPFGNQVNHLDGNKTNNAVSNLEYVTPQENMRHAVLAGISSAGERSGQAKLTNSAVIAIRLAAGAGRVNVSEVAAKYGVHKNSIYAVLQGRSWRHLPSHAGPAIHG